MEIRQISQRGKRRGNLKLDSNIKKEDVLLLLCNMNRKKNVLHGFKFVCSIGVNQVNVRLSCGTHHGFLLLY
jgi:hypothetical protein